MNSKFILHVAYTTILLFSTLASNAQVFWSENFLGGGTSWSLNVSTGFEDPDANIYYVTDDEGGGIVPNLGAPLSCGIASNGNNSLFLSASASLGGPLGAAYFSGGVCGLGICATTNKECQSPIINCTGKSNISLNFNYIENGDGVIDNATLWYFNGTNWTQLDDMPKTLTGCSGQGLWTSRVVAFPPSANNNANVRIAFRWVNNDDGLGTDPSFAVDDITMSTPTSANAITTIINQTFNYKCACDSIGVYFQSSGTFTPNNTYQAQLSNASGSFTTPIIIGSLMSTANVGFIPSTIPCTTLSGTGYRIRVVSTAPATIGTDNGTNIIINSTSNPTITIAQVPANPVCAGTSVNFIATIQNGGVLPTYQWKKNGINVGTNSSTYTTSTYANGDVVYCVLTSNAPCITNTMASSNSLTMVVNPAPTIQITSTPMSGIICAGSQLTLCATGANTYVWSGNIVNCTAFMPTSSNIYTVTATSSLGCTNTATISTIANQLPTIAIASTPINSTICIGDPITLCASGANTYNWTGGITNCTAFTPTATTTYTVTATGTNNCTATSTKIVTVQPILSPSVNITSVPAIPNVGFNASFSANIMPASIINYQLSWYKGNVLQAVINSPNNAFSTLINTLTDTVYAVLTPYNYCVDPDSIKSNKINARYPTSVVNTTLDGVSVFPNPANESITVTGMLHNDQIELVDGIGKQIAIKQLQQNGTIKIEIQHVASGIYFIRIKRNNELSVLKIVKQ
jgi:hypothetical protein